LSHAPPSALAERKAYLAELVRSADENADLLESAIGASYAGVRLPPRLQALLRGQMRKLRMAIDAETRSVSGAPRPSIHAATGKGPERRVLVSTQSCMGSHSATVAMSLSSSRKSPTISRLEPGKCNVMPTSSGARREPTPPSSCSPVARDPS